MIYSYYFVIDQKELRAAGFFDEDAEYSTTAGLISMWSLPVVVPLAYALYRKVTKKTVDYAQM